MKGLGETSAHWLIAQIAVETGISPTELLSLEPRMLFTLQRALVAKANASRKPRKGRR
jgi:hypothetical protein